MNQEVFFEWLQHFIKCTNVLLDNKVVLILDGHKSHTHNLAALELANKQGVIMLSLPPHTSYWMQPLDLTFFKPLKTFYYQAIDDWLKCHPVRAVTMYQTSMLCGQAYGKGAKC